MTDHPDPSTSATSGPGNARLNEIFGEALDLRDEARSTFLADRCGTDVSLRARVEALLAAAEVEDEFLAGVNDHTLEPWRQRAEPPGEREGDRIGPYRLTQRLGEGGFGAVFRAEQDRPIHRAVAVKVLKLGMDTRAVVARFEQERQTLALMDHPNIARVLDAGATPSGRPFFVMDLVEGHRITEYCDQRRLPVRRRLEIFEQVCHAVQHAHTKGVIHRDLKPSNVLVSEHDGGTLARVIDFGIAKATGGSAGIFGDRTLLTEARQVVGTPEYMSPEQAEGGPDIDTRTDVYSLGVLLYELLAGSHPIDRARLRTASFDEVRRIIREEEPPPPSTRLSLSSAEAAAIAERRAARPAELGTLLRGELDWIVLKAMDKDRARRYQSPGALAADLRRYLAGEPVSAAPPSRAYRLRKFLRRHRAPVIAGALVLAAIIAGITGTTIGLVQADRKARDAAKSARIAEAVNALMTTTMQKADRAREGGRADLTVREVMDAAARELTEAPGSREPAVELALSRTIGQTYRELGLYEPAEAMFRITADRAREVHGAASAGLAEALNELGQILKLRGKFDEAGDLYRQAGETFTRLHDAKSLAELSVNMAALAVERADLPLAERLLRDAIGYFESHGLVNGEQYFSALCDLANVLILRGQADQAGPILTRVLDLERRAFGENDPRILETLHGISVVQATLGDPAAETTLREEIAMARRLRGDDHPQVANLLHSLATMLGRKGDLAGAEPLYREGVRIYQKTIGPDHRETLELEMGLATNLYEQHRPDEAEPIYRRALPILIKADEAASGGRWTPDSYFASYFFGSLLLDRSALADARAVVQRAIDAAAALKEGDRYEWMRWSLTSLLGAIATAEAADPALDAASRLARLAAAETLVIPGAERLQDLGRKMGPLNRKRIVGAALDRAVALQETLLALDPTDDRRAGLAQWQQRREEWLAQNVPGR